MLLVLVVDTLEEIKTLSCRDYSRYSTFCSGFQNTRLAVILLIVIPVLNTKELNILNIRKLVITLVKHLPTLLSLGSAFETCGNG